MCLLNILRTIHGDDVEDPRSVPFNVDVAYVAAGGMSYLVPRKRK
jgi:hypothetical protein